MSPSLEVTSLFIWSHTYLYWHVFTLLGYMPTCLNCRWDSKKQNQAINTWIWVHELNVWRIGSLSMLDSLWLCFSLMILLCQNLIVQSWLIKGRGIRHQLTNICWIIEKARELKKKKIYFCFIDHAKPFVSVDHHSCVKYLNKCEYEITLPVSWEICIKVKNEQLDLDMEQLTGSKLGKELTKMYIFIIQNARLDE